MSKPLFHTTFHGMIFLILLFWGLISEFFVSTTTLLFPSIVIIDISELRTPACSKNAGLWVLETLARKTRTQLSHYKLWLKVLTARMHLHFVDWLMCNTVLHQKCWCILCLKCFPWTLQLQFRKRDNKGPNLMSQLHTGEALGGSSMRHGPAVYCVNQSICMRIFHAPINDSLECNCHADNLWGLWWELQGCQ